jgi:DNA-binding FrmR family transcriptional regulator
MADTGLDTRQGYIVRDMAHVSPTKTKLLSRVRRIGGQVAALEKALESDTDCTEVLVQIAAARGAMHGLMMEVLDDHLLEHIVAEPDETKRSDEAAAVIQLLRTYVK